jgi:hypothetical protein
LYLIATMAASPDIVATTSDEAGSDDRSRRLDGLNLTAAARPRRSNPAQAAVLTDDSPSGSFGG